MLFLFNGCTFTLPMSVDGKNLIAGKGSAVGTNSFSAVNPDSGEPLPPRFLEAAATEIDAALDAAEGAFDVYRAVEPGRIAGFLERIGEQISALGDELIRRAQAETALPETRLASERTRTLNQIKMFADLVRDGSWVEASIDRANPERKPLPKPDLRRMLIPIGPVVVFGASNFPLAFSVAGGDTISALAAGNPVVVKAHPAHPGTSELVAKAIQAAAELTGMPAGVFSMVHGIGPEVALRLVRHCATKAVGFTGSLRAGRALFDAAAARPEPIPVYAEMGSTNPVFVLPEALRQNLANLAQGLVQSVTLGVGQFCTNPGLVFGVRSDELEGLIAKAAELAAGTPAGTMLYPAICDRFVEQIERARKISGLTVAGQAGAGRNGQASAIVLATDSSTFQQNEALAEEVFGPSTLIVRCASSQELENIARSLPGQLTATIHGTDADLAQHRTLASILQQKVGRLIFNGFPTGVEVCPSMQHGGPYPATTDVHFTSVGTAAIKRFARPVCFQNFPDAALPAELQRKNPRQIWRLVDNELTRNEG